MLRFLHLAGVAVILLISLSFTLAIPDVAFTLQADYTATIQVNRATWLRTSATWFTANGKHYSTADKSLTLAATYNTAGTDALGHYNATILSWTAESDSLSWMTIYRLYLHSRNPAAVQAIVFDQVWVSGATGTSVNDSNAVLSAFPSFIPQQSDVTLGALQYYGAFDVNQVFVWSGTNASVTLAPGGQSGPLTLFDVHGQVAVTMSPFSQFMSGSLALSKGGVAEYGVVGSMERVPAGYTLSTIAVFGDDGVTNNVLRWGDALLTQYGKSRLAMYEEVATRYLGYSTDNGAFYYVRHTKHYNTEPGKNYEDTLHDVYNDFTARGIPYRHMLIDSWFYYKGALGGDKNWTAMTTIFPSGLQALHANFTMPFTAHNRWWAPETDYATANGGAYAFTFANNFGLPLEGRFWDDLLRNSSVWGLRVYEQDWLYTVWESLPTIRQDITLGRNWLLQMGAGARKVGINIQYCMPYPRHLLQSVEVPNVVQVRASDDNVPGNGHNWQVGESDLLAYSIGVAPFKDTFWTTNDQPGSIYNGTEPAPELQAAIATLSTGPVYPGDKIGYTDTALLARAHRSDGLLLKPDRPAFSLDVAYVERAFGGGGGPDGRQVTHTYTMLNGQRWHVLIVVEEGHGYQLRLRDVGEMAPAGRFVTYYRHNHTTSLPTLTEWTAQSPLTLAPQTRTTASFTLFWAAPVLSNGLVVLGDVSKWVPMSAQRIVSMTEWSGGVIIQLSGGANEAVTISYAVQEQPKQQWVHKGRGVRAVLAWSVMSVDCVLSAAGSGTVTIMEDGAVAQCTGI